MITTWALIATVLAAVAVGVTLGLFGGGGSILMVPMLMYIAQVPGKTAIAMSLLVVAATSAAGLISHARAGRVRWRTGLIFGAAGMAGAYAGGLIGPYLPEAILLGGFAAMMVATAIAMIRGRSRVSAKTGADLPVGRILIDGVVVGVVTGLVGAGGGFLVVPALVLLGGMPMAAAVGTSLLVIAMKSLAGLAGYLQTVTIDWRLAAVVTVAAVVGGLAGGQLAGHINPDRLRRAFGWAVLAMGVFVLAQQVPTLM
ncbi:MULTISPECIES: sulfite exporter TauE/SafE family protein [Streptosporangium]|uniref:Probable membrane transporter protein n=1 Tax=Streptosporangium brasiliense TaxID=47480 RepID=A0ABT9QVG3_9ACTN|nr:sulfite exporter TauE/SafE family protein [Streptosporangium brasiliense]MDP9860981.1 putative membrane protein YfcA [Streptosporangium brasiliense]